VISQIPFFPSFLKKKKATMSLGTLLFPPSKKMLWLICIYNELYFIIENNPKQKIAPGRQHKTNLLPDVILNG